MFSGQLPSIIFNESGLIFLAIAFFNVLSRVFIDTYLTKQARLNLTNFNHGLFILGSFIYGWEIYKEWNSVQKSLTVADNTTVLTVITLISSGIFAFFIYLVYHNDEESFVPKSDVYQIYVSRESEKIKVDKIAAEQRLALLKENIIALKEPWSLKLINLTKENNKDIRPSILQHKTNKFYPHYDRGIAKIMVIELPNQHVLIFVNDTVYAIREPADYYYTYYFDGSQYYLLYDNEQKPRDKVVKQFSKQIHQLNEPTKDQFNKFFDSLISFEEKLLENYKSHEKSSSDFPLGVIWYYVLMIMVGAKIDYLTPVSVIAKALTFLLAFYRLLLLGSFIAILTKG